MGLFGKESQQETTAPKRPTRPSHSATSASAMTSVAPGTRFEGTISGSADIVIEGEVKGSINSTGQVDISETGVVKAAIRGRAIKVAGRVEGNLTADDLIELEPGGVVHGDLLSPRILIKDGANLQGQVEMSKPPAAHKAPETAGATGGGKNRDNATKDQKKTGKK